MTHRTGHRLRRLLVASLLFSVFPGAAWASGANALTPAPLASVGADLSSVASWDVSPTLEVPAMTSVFSLPVTDVRVLETSTAPASSPTDAQGLDTGRAQILLRSLTIPGWGQATLGDKTAATVFMVIDAGIWASFTAFKIQESMRYSSSENTALALAGIQLGGRSEEYKRTVGSYISSDEYNQLVVYRDAANIYYDDPVKYFEYIQQNSVTGSDAWAWRDEESLVRYRDQRKDAQRAAQRANTCLAVAVANRLISAVQAARSYGKHQRDAAKSWNFEMVPSDPSDPTAFHAGVRTRF